MVVAAILNIGASFMNSGAGAGVVDFFHGFQVALMMTVMFNLTQFVWWRCKASRRGSCWQVHQPTVWTLIASILVNIQPMWTLVLGSWKLCCAHNSDLNFPEDATPDTAAVRSCRHSQLSHLDGSCRSFSLGVDSSSCSSVCSKQLSCTSSSRRGGVQFVPRAKKRRRGRVRSFHVSSHPDKAGVCATILAHHRLEMYPNSALRLCLASVH